MSSPNAEVENTLCANPAGPSEKNVEPELLSTTETCASESGKVSFYLVNCRSLIVIPHCVASHPLSMVLNHGANLFLFFHKIDCNKFPLR